MPTIAEMHKRGNTLLARIPVDILTLGVVLLASTAAFGLGYLAGREGRAGEGPGVWIEDVSAAAPAAAALATEKEAPAIPTVPEGITIVPTEGKYVASKNGTKYYLPSCSGAKRIKAENKVWFTSKADAEAAGLGPAANCPGL